MFQGLREKARSPALRSSKHVRSSSTLPSPLDGNSVVQVKDLMPKLLRIQLHLAKDCSCGFCLILQGSAVHGGCLSELLSCSVLSTCFLRVLLPTLQSNTKTNCLLVETYSDHLAVIDRQPTEKSQLSFGRSPSTVDRERNRRRISLEHLPMFYSRLRRLYCRPSRELHDILRSSKRSKGKTTKPVSKHKKH